MHALPAIAPSRLLRLNSRFRQEGGSSSDFVYNLGSSNRQVDSVYECCLISASVPRLYPNIYEPINLLTYSDGPFEKALVVPQGQYTATELAAAISNQTIDFGVEYDQEKSRFVITSSSSITLHASSPIAGYIGLTEDRQSLGVPYALQAPPSLAGPPRLYIQSNFLANINCIESPDNVSEFIPLVSTIEASAVPFGFPISWEIKTIDSSRISFGGRASLRRIDIQICDEFGNVLPLPPNANVDLVFRVYYMP